MNREDIIRMAREAGIDPESDTLCNYDGWVDTLVDFAELVVAAERNSWPAEMEAMERQVNILTDALAQAKAEEREACANAVWECPGMGLDDQRKAMSAIRARGQA